MRKKTSMILFCTVFLSIVLLLGTTKADAACSPTEEAAGNCFVAGGYKVQFTGAFNNYTEFGYMLTPDGTNKNVSIVDLLIPICDPPITVSSGDPSGWSQSEPGAGGQSTGWGNVAGFTVAEINFDTDLPNLKTNAPTGADKTAMGLKIGNKIYSGVINGPACILPPPPIVIGAEYISVEGHPDYLMQVNKDVYGNLREICLVTNPDHIQVACTTGGEITYDGIKINLGDLGDTLIVCRTGDLTASTPTVDVTTCDYLTFATESEVKGGHTTCGFKFKSGRYAYTCW
jgi:hypothetical protein